MASVRAVRQRPGGARLLVDVDAERAELAIREVGLLAERCDAQPDPAVERETAQPLEGTHVVQVEQLVVGGELSHHAIGGVEPDEVGEGVEIPVLRPVEHHVDRLGSLREEAGLGARDLCWSGQSGTGASTSSKKPASGLASALAITFPSGATCRRSSFSSNWK